ncbi:MAG TPA: molecular chaperone TorD family protein [Planctomycetota bacterium]|nr:molecular chaperone TorD family protein [Planctomycetota bacterium]
MNAIDLVRSREELALARAVLYRFASDLFRDPLPEREAEWQRQSAGVLASLEVCQESGSPAALATALEACVSGASGAGQAPAGPSARSGLDLAAQPYETEWLPAAGDLGRFHHISDIAELYRAFGLERIGSDQRADHLSVELAFMHFLCVKEAYAEENALADLASICRDAERGFLGEHLARWAPSFCAQIARAGERGFRPGAASFVQAWLADESRRLATVHDERRAAPPASASSPAARCGDCRHTLPCSERTSAQGADLGQA